MQKTGSFADTALVSSGLKVKQKFLALRAARVGSVYVPNLSAADLAATVGAVKSHLVAFNIKFGEGENGLDVRISVDGEKEKEILAQAQDLQGDKEALLANAKVVVLISGRVDAKEFGYVIGMMPYRKIVLLESTLEQKHPLDTSHLEMLVLASGKDQPNNTVLATLWKNYCYSNQRITILLND